MAVHLAAVQQLYLSRENSFCQFPGQENYRTAADGFSQQITRIHVTVKMGAANPTGDCAAEGTPLSGNQCPGRN